MLAQIMASQNVEYSADRSIRQRQRELNFSRGGVSAGAVNEDAQSKPVDEVGNDKMG